MLEKTVEGVDFGRLPALYKEKRYNQTSFAEAVEIGQPYLSEIVNNKKNVTLPLFFRMAAALGMRPSKLMGRLEKSTANIA